MYIFIIIILVALFIFCCWGFTLSLKRHNKIKNLQSSADYNFETKQGSYTFNYLIKAFDNNGGKIVKIIVAPYIGFSDLKNFKTNKLKARKIFLAFFTCLTCILPLIILLIILTKIVSIAKNTVFF